MKKILGIIFLSTLIGCSQEPRVKSTSGVDIDSLIQRSEKNFQTVNQANKRSDSTITNKVDKTVQKIGNLETQVTELKKENNELKEKLDDATNGNGKPFKLVPVSND